MNKKLSQLRLQKETADLQKNPIQNALVARNGHNFHFCLYNLHPPYSGGFYHGVLQLHEDYPLRAPKLIFKTPSGRFQINTPICTSFTNFHQQTWTAAWNVRTLILATISFMYSEQPSFGCRSDSELIRKNLALSSKRFNLKNQQFLRIFEHKMSLMQMRPQEEDSSIFQGEELMNNNELIDRNNELIVNINNNNHQINQAEIDLRRAKSKKIFIFILFLFLVWALF